MRKLRPEQLGLMLRLVETTVRVFGRDALAEGLLQDKPKDSQEREGPESGWPSLPILVVNSQGLGLRGKLPGGCLHCGHPPSPSGAQPWGRCGGRGLRKPISILKELPPHPPATNHPPFTQEETKARRGHLTKEPERQSQVQPSSSPSLMEFHCPKGGRGGGKEKGRKLALPVALPQLCSPGSTLRPQSTQHLPPCHSGRTLFLGALPGLGPHLAPPQPPAMHTVGVQ